VIPPFHIPGELISAQIRDANPHHIIIELILRPNTSMNPIKTLNQLNDLIAMGRIMRPLPGIDYHLDFLRQLPKIRWPVRFRARAKITYAICPNVKRAIKRRHQHVRICRIRNVRPIENSGLGHNPFAPEPIFAVSYTRVYRIGGAESDTTLSATIYRVEKSKDDRNYSKYRCRKHDSPENRKFDLQGQSIIIQQFSTFHRAMFR